MQSKRGPITIRPLRSRDPAGDRIDDPVAAFEMMWPLTLDAWAFKGDALAESRLPRHIA